MTHSQLHQKAIDALALINENRDAIQAAKDNLVSLEKDILLDRSIKDIFMDQQVDILKQIRAIKATNVQNYATIMQLLNQPVVERMSVSSNGLNFSI